MTGWFAHLPIHRKLVALALMVTATALVLATASLVAVDVWRFRVTAIEDTSALAQVVAENMVAAVTFQDEDAARTILATLRVRPGLRRGCVYLESGRLFAGFNVTDALVCPATVTRPTSWRIVAGNADVTRNGRQVGRVYVERDLSEIAARIAIAAVTGLVVLLAAGGVAFLLAHRLHRLVSSPITRLAAAARGIDPSTGNLHLPDLDAGGDEVGDLVRAFRGMLERVHDANARLIESNDTLRRQESEREGLLRREREASRLKDEFLAAVSHELRTPLNAIVGWVQILTTATANERTLAKAIASIERNARAQTRVIEDLVDVSRIAAGTLNIRVAPVSLREVVEAALDTLRGAAEARAIDTRVTLPADACIVHGDRDRLQQVVWNLLSNAIKFTPEGGAMAVELAIDRRHFTVAVTDSGIGIEPSFLPQVFEKFRQADGSITRERGGLGLGLAIVKELTELHGGSVTAVSAGLGRGATFVVRLPRCDVVPVAGPSDAAAAVGRRASLDGVEILAVDDNADALDVLAATLGQAGATVRMVTSGAEAIAEWERRPADVLICDLAMPHMDGFEVLQAIRMRDREVGRGTPAIALSAYASADYVDRTRRAGFAAHVGKPAALDDLINAVRAVIDEVRQ